LWNGLLAEAPANSPLHQALIDRIAMLTAQSGGGAPDPKMMVAGLAARLKDNPNDAAGWQRLIRAYSVLGERAEAQTALATARQTFAAQKDVLAALDAEAGELKLN
jgi:cytochrome c-type biogenesis protein CcmH